ncbi:aminotransferase [Candidatus Koribacter versatilis Ellin345]|uniref:Aminotransferase n=1 Tax=Koribacter versatilis (strain Ellin345) TaxID=204669 RepID=Q1IRM3_KORVE|nr:aminotransferase class I/II-fold pyridoxal phosphate-dependent enzyme [Candidatus Koribacter versatilis]ABF40477.1 aminotransferase [Candidatus Koribacter versatilis Ellin345]
MTSSRTAAHSPYMEYAKLYSAAKYNLATSGVMSYPLAELPVRLEDLEINGPTVYGYAPLQERLAKLNGVKEENVVAAYGTSMANHLAMAGTFDSGDEVLIEEPTYELLTSALAFLGAKIKRFPRPYESGFAIDPADVKRVITPNTKLIVITNLHNPSSVLTSDAVLREVGEIAAKHGARVLVDEVYLEALGDKRPKPAIHLGENFLVTSSLTKAFGLSGVRCGWILAEPKLAHRIWRMNDLFAATPSHPADRISVIALDNLSRVAERAHRILDENHRALNELLASRNEIDFVNPGVGTTVFPKLRSGSVEAFDRFLREKYETAIVPGKFFEMPQHFRIGLGGDTAMTREGLKRLATALAEFRP